LFLELEGGGRVEEPSLDQVREAVLGLKAPRPTFLCLTHRNGDYIQIVGGRPWCRVELRRQTARSHWCAFQDTPNPKYKDGAKLRSGAGEILMAHDEWFLLKDAADIVSAFYNQVGFPPHVQWRSMNEMFGL
jgi:hypothetical protein